MGKSKVTFEKIAKCFHDGTAFGLKANSLVLETTVLKLPEGVRLRRTLRYEDPRPHFHASILGNARSSSVASLKQILCSTGYEKWIDSGDGIELRRWMCDQYPSEIQAFGDIGTTKLSLRNVSKCTRIPRAFLLTKKSFALLMSAIRQSELPWVWGNLSFAKKLSMRTGRLKGHRLLTEISCTWTGEKRTIEVLCVVFGPDNGAQGSVPLGPTIMGELITTFVKLRYDIDVQTVVCSASRQFENLRDGIRAAEKLIHDVVKAFETKNIHSSASAPSHFAEQNLGGDGRRSLAGGERAVVKASRTGVGTKARSKSKA
jgi:hypothetical protein